VPILGPGLVSQIMKQPLQPVKQAHPTNTGEFDDYRKWNIRHVIARKEKPPLLLAKIFVPFRVFARAQ
jgi:hypothetical protein